jgi:hypothetical protein
MGQKTIKTKETPWPKSASELNRSSFRRLSTSVVKWSEFLAIDPEVRVQFLALPDFLRNTGYGTGPLSLVSTTEELLERNRSGSDLENRKYNRRDPSR